MELHKELTKLVAEFEKMGQGWKHHVEALEFCVGNLYPWPAAITVLAGSCMLLVAVFLFDTEG